MNSYNINYPFQDDQETNSFLLMNQVTKDSYSSNLILLLLTQKNERLYEPDFGTNLLKYIFEPTDDLTESQIEEEIKNTVSLYIPEIKITSVTFKSLIDDSGQSMPDNQINVNVKFVYIEGALNDVGSVDLNF